MAFLDVRFPVDISYGSAGGPGYQTTVVTTQGGREYRNSQRSMPLYEYNAACGVKSRAQMAALCNFFNAVGGRAHSFRWKDHLDFQSCLMTATPAALDQAIGTGDGTTAAFQLKKTYTEGALSRVRTILKPVSGTVLVAVAGVVKTVTTHYTVDHATGIVTFTAGNIPTAGQSVTAGYEFDVPARFDIDSLRDLTWESFDILSAQIPVLEVRDAA
jgi:uncharacterized protein (TIGR02217 family)